MKGFGILHVGFWLCKQLRNINLRLLGTGARGVWGRGWNGKKSNNRIFTLQFRDFDICRYNDCWWSCHGQWSSISTLTSSQFCRKCAFTSLFSVMLTYLLYSMLLSFGDAVVFSLMMTSSDYYSSTLRKLHTGGNDSLCWFRAPSQGSVPSFNPRCWGASICYQLHCFTVDLRLASLLQMLQTHATHRIVKDLELLCCDMKCGWR